MPTRPKPQKPAETPASTLTDDEKKLSKAALIEWLNKKQAFVEAQSAERTHRAIIATAFGVEGRSKTTKAHGFKVEVTNGTDYSVDKGIMDVLNEVLTAEVCKDPAFDTQSAIQNRVDEIVYSVFRFTPELKVSAYKALPENFREVLEKFITTSPSSAQVKVTPIEEK